MPTYDYLCPNGHRFEVIHSVSAAGPETCPVCGAAPVRKAVTAPTVHFKGSGWAKKDRRATSTSGASAKADTATGEAGAPASTKDKDKDNKEAGSKGDASISGSASAAPGPSAPSSSSSAAD
jgi:putative FmdB family regulatory protein